MMVDSAELSRLLSLVRYRRDLNFVEGLDAFRTLLERDRDDDVLRFLVREIEGLEGRVQGGVAYVIAEHYLNTGNLSALQRLFAAADSGVKESVLNALWGQPPASNPAAGAGIIALALEAAIHPAPGVRSEACSVIQNQCGWGVDVAEAVEPLLALLGDPSGRVRMQAACAVGNLAKRRYDVSRHIDALRLNLRHDDCSVRAWSAWALWQLSRSRYDIGDAVRDLVELLASRREDDADARKHAASALLQHAKSSVQNRQRVRQCADAANLDGAHKHVRRFREQLAGLD